MHKRATKLLARFLISLLFFCCYYSCCCNRCYNNDYDYNYDCNDRHSNYDNDHDYNYNCVHWRARTWACAYTCMCMHARAMHACVCASVRVFECAYVGVRVHLACAYTCMCIHARAMHARLHTRV